ncbi:MAG TPA: hypothetical protein VHY09_10295, partial [Candidatus Methylacidiphilales bacterium]|nr:hypothetical protein [Candidatus Methylacidiphilales bacterium]
MCPLDDMTIEYDIFSNLQVFLARLKFFRAHWRARASTLERLTKEVAVHRRKFTMLAVAFLANVGLCVTVHADPAPEMPAVSPPTPDAPAARLKAITLT